MWRTTSRAPVAQVGLCDLSAGGQGTPCLWCTWPHIRRNRRGGRPVRRAGRASGGSSGHSPQEVQELIELRLGPSGEAGGAGYGQCGGRRVCRGQCGGKPRDAPGPPEAVYEVWHGRGSSWRNWGLAVWPDGTVSRQYRFRHAVYQQVLTAS